MTNLTQAQTELLNQAAAAPEGAIAAPDHAKLAKPLIKQGLIISVPMPEGGSRLLITDAGRIAIGAEAETAAYLNRKGALRRSRSLRRSQRLPRNPQRPRASRGA